MPSSFTASARFTLQATGENTNVWGTILNNGAFALIDDAIAGVTTVSATGATTLTTANGATDQARRAVINYTGATAGTLTIPSVSKVYVVRAATADCTLTNGSSSATVKAGNIQTVITDGTNIWLGLITDFGSVVPKTTGAPTVPADLVNKTYSDAQLAEAKAYTDETAFSSITNLPGQTGNAGKFLTTNGSVASWGVTVAPAERKTANYTAVSGDRLECDTTGGAFTVTLPATPAANDIVTVFDGGATISGQGFATNNLTIGRNGSTINGLSEDAVIRTKGAAVVFEYLNSTWRVRLG